MPLDLEAAARDDGPDAYDLFADGELELSELELIEALRTTIKHALYACGWAYALGVEAEYFDGEYGARCQLESRDYKAKFQGLKRLIWKLERDLD